MITGSLIENIIANYLPSIVYAVLSMVYIWTLSEKPLKRETKGGSAVSHRAANEVYYY
jgi:hypothetical protein